MSVLCCPLCGITLLPDPYQQDDPDPPLSRTRPWNAEVRGIVMAPGKSAHDADKLLTGLGVLRDDNVLIAPVDTDLSYLDCENLDKWVLCETFNESGGFGFHGSCWKLLELRLGPMDEESKSAVLTAMFWLLWSTPCVGCSTFDFGHDYDRGEVFRRLDLPPVYSIESSHLHADPCSIPPLDDPAAVFIHGIDRSQQTQIEESPRLFGVLPAELKDEIFSYLSYHELKTMGTVSREVAQFTRDYKLPQSYWRSRFMLGQEMDFVFPDLTTQQWDWRLAYFATKMYLHSRHESLINRKRIRKLIEPLAALMKERAVMRLPILDGHRLVLVQNSNGFLCMRSQEGEDCVFLAVDSGYLLSGHLTSIGPDDILQLGCRLQNWAMYPLGHLGRMQYSIITVSKVRLGSRNFVSGISMLANDSGTAEPNWVGYPGYTEKERIEIPKAFGVESISVAFCPQGLRGIRFNFTNSDPSVWVGDSSGLDVAWGILPVPSSMPCALVVGTDRFKIVSLGIGVLLTGSELSPQQLRELLPTPLPHLWLNRMPSHDGLVIGDLRPQIASPRFEPLVNMDFGGPNGVRLSSLTRIVFHMGGDDNPIMGVEAIFADGNPVFVGDRGGCELSFAINGVDGERIIRVGVVDNSRLPGDIQFTEDCLFGIEVTTNYGRTARFATIKSRLARSLVYVYDQYPQYAITGLAIAYVPHKNRFSRLALQYQESQPLRINPPVQPQVPHDIVYQSLEYDARLSMFTDYRGGSSYQTHATLTGVRRIQAAVGIKDRSRSPNSVCGLKFEYDNSSISIIGQWMQPYHTFELRPDEQIQSVTVWVNQLRQGQVSAVRIETNRARTMTFAPHGVGCLPQGDQRHQYGTGPGERVTDIFWVLNGSFDRVRALVDQKVKRTSILLPDQYPPFDAVQKLYFERIASDGSRDRIVMAEAYFHGTALLGLQFVYESGERARIGDLKGHGCERIRVVKNARFVGMLVGIRDGYIRYLKFHLDYYDNPSFGLPAKRFSYNLDLVSPLEVTMTGRYDIQSAWCRDAESAARFPRAQVNHSVFAPPSRGGALAGLYVRCQQFSGLGAVYE